MALGFIVNITTISVNSVKSLSFSLSSLNGRKCTSDNKNKNAEYDHPPVKDIPAE